MTIKNVFEKFAKLLLGGTLAKRLILFLFIGIFIPILFMVYFTISGNFNKMVDQYAQKDLSNIYFLSKSIGTYYNSLKSLPMDFYNGSDDFDKIVYGSDYVRDGTIYNKVKRFFYSRSDIDNIRFYSSQDSNIITLHKYGTNNLSINRNDKIDISMLPDVIPYFNCLNENSRQYISQLGENYDSKGKVFTIDQLILDYDNKKVLSVLSMDFNVSFMNDLISDINLEAGETFFLLNKRLELMYEKAGSDLELSSNNDLKPIWLKQNKGISYININNEKNLVLHCWDKNHEYLLIRSIPVQYIFRDAKTVLIKDSFLLGIFIVLFFLIILIISNSVTIPIKELVKTMKKVETGKFDVKIQYKTNNSEFSLLFDKFNMMTEEINMLFNERFKLQLAQKTAEFQALQAQINPHFMYNTLQTIQYLAVKRHAYEISSIISAFSDILKYCITNKSNIVLLGEELEYVEKFLLIQRFKYVNNLEVQLNYSDDVKLVKVPKMILQPLIENCFIHGFDEVNKLQIWVTCTKTDKYISIEISDNGKGIDNVKLEELQLLFDNKQVNDINYSGEEVGIMNVYTRLNILFKNNINMHISSIPFEKTTVTIEIPFFEGENI